MSHSKLIIALDYAKTSQALALVEQRPKMAVDAGSDYLVIGRSITHAADPLAVVQQLQNDVN